MADDKEQQSPYPLMPDENSQPPSDMEAAATPDAARERRRKKRAKCILHIILFAVFQTGIILLFTFTVMKIRTPKFRVRSATFQNFTAGMATNPSFDIKMTTELGIKNTNFGRFKFDSTYMSFFYRGTQVAEAFVPKGQANWRSTKKFRVVVGISMASVEGNSELASDLRAGAVPLTSRANLKGNVRLAMMFVKKKSADMNCTMEIVIATEELRNIVCK